MIRLAFVSLVNDTAQFEACQESLRKVADVMPEWLKVEPNLKGWNAAQGLNHGIEQLDADWIVCLHQDVLFPEDFWQRLTTSLANMPDDVALAGLVGCDHSGRFRGHIIDPNGHCYWPSLPRQVLALDEVLIAVRKSSGLRFCEDVPGFHCYGADLCFEADRLGMKTMAIDAPLVHLSTGKLDESYDRASSWLMEKWGERYGYVLPMPALLLQDQAKAGMLRRFMQRLRRRGSRLSRNTNQCPDAKASTCIAHALGESVSVRGES